MRTVLHINGVLFSMEQSSEMRRAYFTELEVVGKFYVCSIFSHKKAESLARDALLVLLFYCGVGAHCFPADVLQHWPLKWVQNWLEVQTLPLAQSASFCA